MLAPALGRHRGDGAFDQLQQRLLHAFAGNIPRNGRIVGFARNLIDLVDIHDAGLCLFDVVIAFLQQFLNNVFHILADITRFGQCRGIGDSERHI